MNRETEFHDKRRFPRIPIDAQYVFEVDGVTYRGEIGNLSLGGVYLSSYEPTIPSEALLKEGKIKLDLRGIKRRRFRCRVVYLRGVPHIDGAGVSFESLTPQQLKALKDVITAIS